MTLKFPFGVSQIPGLGQTSTVYTLFEVQAANGVLPFFFLFDTGADLTSLPVSSAIKLGIDLDKCPEGTMTSYDGTVMKVYKSSINILINKKNFIVPCVFNPNEEVPIVLGRAGILDKFTIVLDGKNKQIIFREI